MLHQIKELLQNAQLQQQVKAATNQAEAIKVLAIASAEKGYNFTLEAISQMLTDLLCVESDELSEEELLGVSGGAAGDTHVHMSCCNDCPTR
ncbi:Nif11-like leader peptide family natural product precursor [Nostoc sp. CENA67]|uniref:Nif11-like leader peptide family natural product n=1 Tax=Amazonocrinis nigriterrae CENA67 TaxID=2794033 RepID=A0A8J7HQP6_9NOST|nr:Nif11-like leader peptide family natural product precursor [Amazonocrinis nigriterrae]MBH8561770.1 Nif11-like leader peptide family natural product precursor [Amazonocrinis nigriterrae CENA67]